jgi:hypothetical protein
MSLLPQQCAIAFKEWSQICQVLADGRQTLIVRKGGIREGPGGFSPDHWTFWLYPTYVHQAQQGLRVREPEPLREISSPTDPVSIRALAVVELIWHLSSETQLLALAPFHIWSLETIRSRFTYRLPGLWVLGVRVFRQDQPWTLTPSVEQLGCKSWVLLDAPLRTTLLRPALDDDAWMEQIGSLREALGPDAAAGPPGSPS